MVTLSRAKNGDWFARKGIPADVREAYKAAFGVSQEERFRHPATLSASRAKQELRDWDSLISGRIEDIRAARIGGGRSLTLKEAHGLAAQWYGWFVARHEPRLNEFNGLHWDRWLEELQDRAESGPADPDTGEPEVTERSEALVRAFLQDAAEVTSFLAESRTALDGDGLRTFLDALQPDFIGAVNHLRRRAEGDFRRDPKEPGDDRKALFQRRAGLTVKALFARWIETREPSAQTVGRWRAALLSLEERFAAKDITEIGGEDAAAWKSAIQDGNRSAQTTQVTWIRAATIVFQYAVEAGLIQENPFKGLKVPQGRKKPKLREQHFRPSEAWAILRATKAEPPKRLKSHKAAARRWIPWLCAYTGCRAGEAAQLRAEDVTLERGKWWCMRITPEAGTVKTGEARTVPLHPDLIAQGFLKYVEEVGSGPLFYDAAARRITSDDLTKPVRAPWEVVRIKLAEWVRNDVRVDAKGISPNHAWRHLFKTRAEDPRLSLSPALVDKIVGHASGNVGDRYRQIELGQLVAAMEKFPRYRVELDPPADWDEDITASLEVSV